MLAVLSNRRIVIPEPRTGKVSTNSIDADKIVQLNKHASILIIPVLLEISNEAIKVIDPPSEETPKTCRAKIANEILELLEYVESDKGQYNVHPADIPSSREIASTTSIEAETNAYKDPKFTLGNTKSAARYDWGSCQLPAKESNIGIINKNIIPRPWEEINLLYASSEPGVML